ncbi:MAG: OprD family outer membrane porin [Sulfuricurvum sp.]|uniref:OprD family outer membrane porin n=1 Tax=Sulfuricurvum sp. TaxID=2025608 RepID=UPI002629DE1F|nr:OprD family outer membrane porin [Sulfuricurvum sp.]MDD2368544.1 OprD family outer membrane porin [Sulfuricurvum sp.]MDD2949292.1 OprD family outer membrane porin [Sulfuricurvum sp.]MDD5119304.1 OprD family outer membrane porin [Sulfuricurvum sp.]
MKKTVALSLATVAVLNASSIEDVFGDGKVSGEIRTAYINQNNKVDTDTYGTSVGGILKYETAPWNDLKLGIGAYGSQKLNFATGDFDEGRANPDLFGKDTHSFAYIGEAYLDYSIDDVTLRVGRQLIDIPFADTDDIRMHPNSFEAAMITYKGVEETALIGGYISRWAGYDSGNDISKFKKMAPGSNGAVVVGISNESLDNIELNGWYYGIDKLSDIFYGDAKYTMEFGEVGSLELIGQLARFNEKNNSDVDGNIYGVGVNLSMGMFTLGAEYNKAFNAGGKHIISGFGNGPYVVDTEEVDLDDFEDVNVYQFNAEADMGDIDLKDVTLFASYSKFKSAPDNTEADEIDLIARYKVTEALNAEVNYVVVNDKNKNLGNNGTNDYNGGYNRFLVRINYNF